MYVNVTPTCSSTATLICILYLKHVISLKASLPLVPLLSVRLLEKKEKALKRLSEQLKKLKLQETDREENKVIALGTSKLNYLDPRITVAW